MREMVDSGVEWIGEIPRGWRVERLSDIASIENGFPFEVDGFSAEIGMPVIKMGNFNGEDYQYSQLKLNKRYIVEKGDLLIGLSGSLSVIIWNGPNAYLNQRIAKVRGKACINSFLFGCLRSAVEDASNNESATTIKNLSKKQIDSLAIPFPPLSEQKAIAAFLDRETDLIDRRIDLIERKREYLRELRKSVIHEAVTKGLDKEAEMVDSGVEWIGEIPRGWRVERFSHLLKSIQTGKKDVSYSEQSGAYNFYTCGQEILKCSSPAYFGSSILMAGNGDISNIKFTGSDEGFDAYQRVYVLKIKDEFIFKYAYWLLVAGFVGYVSDLQKGSVIDFIRVGNVVHYQICLPPISEQKIIVDFLDRECDVINKMDDALLGQMDLLKEQRKTLIHEVVTGKKNVNGG